MRAAIGSCCVGAFLLAMSGCATPPAASQRPMVPSPTSVAPASSPPTATAQPAVDPQRPAVRPSSVVSRATRPAIFTENKSGTTNISNIAIDAKWSNYGAYLQRLIDTVQTQWERILVESRKLPTAGTQVTVKFVLNSAGEITRIISVDTTANEIGAHACVAAITDRAPYGPWTDDMKAMLGGQQEMTFTFYYQ